MKEGTFQEKITFIETKEIIWNGGKTMKHFKAALSILIALAIPVLPGTAKATPSRLWYDFEQDDAGFVPIFADYPATEGADTFYELDARHDSIPIEQAGKGLYLAGNNHSDDLFMGYYKELTGLPENANCIFRVRLKLATNVRGGLVGIGGSPGSSVYVKCGITEKKPLAVVTEQKQYRLNLDKGNQGAGGKDMEIVGDLEQFDELLPGKYEWKDIGAVIEATPDKDGKAYFIIGTDSGFEGLSSYYIDDVEIEWIEKSEAPVSRAEAIQLLYEATSSNCEAASVFGDVDEDSPYRNAIGWTQNNRYISGHENGTFTPNEKMTGEQAMTVLYRYAGSPPVSLDADLEKVSPWARNAVQWGLQKGLCEKSDFADSSSVIGEGDYIIALWKVVALRQ